MREQRLYYDQPYCQEFQSELLTKEKRGDFWYVELNQTAFYPTSGGQPNDLGQINGLQIQDVIEEDERVWHVLSEDPGAGVMNGQLDWPRRWDFMQQHGGQHILSQVFWRLLQATTIGFHLTETSLTIDLDIPGVSESELNEAEQLANEIVWSNKRIFAHWCDDAQLQTMPLRKLPKVDHDIRIVEVEGYDWSPCGGTHPAYTAEVGIIKIRRAERSKGVTRIEFMCGNRALDDYRFKNQFALSMAADLSVKDRELPQAWQKYQSLLKETESTVKTLKEELIGHRVAELYATRQEENGYAIVQANLSQLNIAELKQISAQLIAMPQTIALLASTDSGQVALARSQELEWLNLNVIFKPLIAEFSGKGGGTAQSVQGALANSDQTEVFFSRFIDAIKASSKS